MVLSYIGAKRIHNLRMRCHHQDRMWWFSYIYIYSRKLCSIYRVLIVVKEEMGLMNSCFQSRGVSMRTYNEVFHEIPFHYSGVIMSVMASEITGVSIVYSTVCSGADQRKHQSFASPAFVRGIHRWPVNSPHKGPVTPKMFHLMTSSYESDFSPPAVHLRDTSQDS